MSLHPEGQFTATVLDHGLTTSNRGNTQLAVKFETEHGEITGWFAMTDKAIEYTMEKIIAMGYRQESLVGLNDGRCLVGNKCVITVAHQNYEDKTSAKVSFVNPEGYAGKEIKRDSDATDNVKRFDALLRKKLRSAPVQQDNTEACPETDDVPF